MWNVVNVMFDLDERQLFEKAELWRGLLEGEGKERYQDAREMSRVLRALAHRDPGGQSWTVLERGRVVLTAIAGVAQVELDQWREIAKHAPERGEENSIIARPQQAAQAIIEARQQAVSDSTAALGLVIAAQGRATRHVDERAAV